MAVNISLWQEKKEQLLLPYFIFCGCHKWVHYRLTDVTVLQRIIIIVKNEHRQTIICTDWLTNVYF